MSIFHDLIKCLFKGRIYCPTLELLYKNEKYRKDKENLLIPNKKIVSKMPKKFHFSSSSEKHIEKLHPDLQKVIRKVLNLGVVDFAIIESTRGEVLQNKYFSEGKSTLKWPKSKHNKTPSEAFHFSLIIQGKYNDTDDGAYYMAIGLFIAIGLTLGIKLRSGGDWNGDFGTKDQKLNDLMHIELVKKD